jgi:hypothetical protein
MHCIKEEETLQANKGLEGRQTRLELKSLNHRGRQLKQKTQSSSPGAAISKLGPNVFFTIFLQIASDARRCSASNW